MDRILWLLLSAMARVEYHDAGQVLGTMPGSCMSSLVGGNIILTKPQCNLEKWTGQPSLSPIYRRNNRLREVKSFVQIQRATNWPGQSQSWLRSQLRLAAYTTHGIPKWR